MAKGLAITTPAVFTAITLLLAYRWYDRFPWLAASVRVHSESGSTNCGHLTNSGYEAHPDADTVIHCVESAHQQRHPFFVTMSLYGVDDAWNSAIVGDSRGQVIEIFYSRGMAERANELLKRRCDSSDELLVHSHSPYDPFFHCHPWPPATFERDHIFW